MKDSALRVGIYQGPEIPQSFRVYAENVWRHLPKQDIAIIPFKDRKDLPKSADVLWDIRSGGGNPPPDFLLEHPLLPLVVTVHGFAPVSLNGWEYFRTLKGLIMSGQYAKHKRERWREARTAVGSIIAVSAFVKDEAIRFTGVPADRIHVCHHGVDSNAFTLGSDTESEPYFFHVSNDEPRKNVRAIVRAFRQLRRHCRVQLVLKLPEESARNYEKIEGVRVLSGFLTTEELVRLYRHALAFIFPSLYEGFGLPILEAMACGCPVITSNVSACPEIAGEAARTINPRNESELLEAMEILYRNPEERRECAATGLRRALGFSWEESAKCHARVLYMTADRNAPTTSRDELQ
jgi:glycosyltransferase involved in cell wall biosynthesis